MINVKKIYANEQGTPAFCYEEDGVTFYGPSQTLYTDIQVQDDVERVAFGGKNITGLIDYNLKNCNFSFPNVKEIYIARNVSRLFFNNKMFPNCRKVISGNDFYKSGDMLVCTSRREVYGTLLNTFCLRSNETANLAGISKIYENAFSGCKMPEITHAECLNYVSPLAFEDSGFMSDKNNADGGILMAGPIVLKLLDNTADYVLPKCAIIAADSGVVLHEIYKANSLTITGPLDNALNLLPKSLADTVIVKNIKQRHPNTDDHLSELLESKTTSRIILENCNGYKSIDGILYTEDILHNLILLKCPVKMKVIKIAAGTTEIARNAFERCEIEEVIMPNSVVTIGDNAFCGCKELRNIVFSQNLQTCKSSFINGGRTFLNCRSLNKVEIPASLKIIPNAMFIGCTSLSEVILHDGLEEIEADAFERCINLKKISLPATVHKLHEYCFPDIEEIRLTSTKIPDGIFHACVDYMDCDGKNQYYTCIISACGEKLYVPKDMGDAGAASLLNHWKIYGNTNNAYKYGGSSYSKYETALAIYEENLKIPSTWIDIDEEPEELKTFLIKNSVNIVDFLLRKNKRSKLARFITYQFLSEKALDALLKYANKQDLSDIAAYTLEQLKGRAVKLDL